MAKSVAVKGNGLEGSVTLLGEGNGIDVMQTTKNEVDYVHVTLTLKIGGETFHLRKQPMYAERGGNAKPSRPVTRSL